MSRITPTKTDVKKLYDILEQEDATLEQVAMQVAEKCFDLYESKAKYAVVAQIKYSDGTYFKPTDPAASKVSLGLYPSEAKAKTDARSLAYSAATHEEAKVWILPVHWGTPNSWYIERKAEAADAAAEAKAVLDRMRADDAAKLAATREGACGEEFVGPLGEVGYCMREPGHQFSHWSPTVSGFDKCQGIVLSSNGTQLKCTLIEGHNGDHYNPERK